MNDMTQMEANILSFKEGIITYRILLLINKAFPLASTQDISLWDGVYRNLRTHNLNVVLPHRKPNNGELSKTKDLENAKRAEIRGIVERKFGEMTKLSNTICSRYGFILRKFLFVDSKSRKKVW